METIFRKLIDSHFSDLAGLTANASIPISQSLLNEIIQAALRGNQTITSFSVSLHEQNRVAIRLKTSALPWAMHLKLKLDQSVDLESFSSPKLRAWLENHQLLGSLGSFFKILPEWVQLYGSQIVIDLGYFFPAPEQKQFLDLVEWVGIRTEEGKAVLDVKIRVESQI
jgi:hypothetical protein